MRCPADTTKICALDGHHRIGAHKVLHALMQADESNQNDDEWARISIVLIELSAGEAIRHAKEFSLTICKDINDETMEECALTERDKSSFRLVQD